MSRPRSRVDWPSLLPLLAVLAACGGNDDKTPASAGPEASPTKSLYTLTPIPLPPKPPPTGKLIADIEQSSRDGAANRFQVWIDNDTDEHHHADEGDLPRRPVPDGLPGTRLRDIPSQARRGFPIYQPDQPACDRTASSGTVTVDYTVNGEHKSETVPVRGRGRGDRADHVGALPRAGASTRWRT